MSEVKVNKITPTTNCGTVTLGDSGDTVAIPAGVTLDVQGTSSGITDISWDTTAKTAGFTAVAGNGYFVNTTSEAITVTLPATPSVGDFVGIKDYANTADTNNITIARNGSNIQGTANDFIISTEGLSIILIYVDATQGWVSTGAAQASNISDDVFITATGGTITTCGDYKIHTFTGPGTFCVTAGAGPVSVVDYLVIAGGAGGGSNLGGGGGAGGYRESSGATSGCYSVSPLGACVSALPVSASTYPVTVGGGGTGGSLSRGGDGSNSIFSTITSTGGGGGGGRPACKAGNPGGSGGGGSSDTGGTGGSGNTPPVSPPQGNDGGSLIPGRISSGGGGATVVGSDPPGSSGGPGGAGATSSINGTPTARAGGGGGGGEISTPLPGGTGGTGGGGNGGDGGQSGCNGTVNTGGGGGGEGNSPSGTSGGAGGSGIVIIRYKYQ